MPFSSQFSELFDYTIALVALATEVITNPIMADSDATVRRRKPEPKSGLTPDQQQADSETERRESEAPKGKKKSSKARLEEEDDYSPWIDVLRVLSFLFFASCALSYLISSGESYFWGMKDKPNYLQPKWWKAKFVRTITPCSIPSTHTNLRFEGRPRLSNSRRARPVRRIRRGQAHLPGHQRNHLRRVGQPAHLR